jgi:hypothetical protein
MPSAVCHKYLRVSGEYCYRKIKASFDKFFAKENLVRKIFENATEKEENTSKYKL